MILALSFKARAARAAAFDPPIASRLPVFLKDLVGYGLCSAAALVLDCGLLFGLTSMGLNYLPAAAIGFFSGMVLAYLLSIRFVYADRRSPNHAWEAFGFFIIGIAGLALNQVLLFGFVDGLDLSLALAKGLTTLCVFLFNFAARRSVLFSSSIRTAKG
jgi:putative flippase GtrA